MTDFQKAFHEGQRAAKVRTVLDRMLNRKRCPSCGAINPSHWHNQGNKCSECPQVKSALQRLMDNEFGNIKDWVDSKCPEEL